LNINLLDIKILSNTITIKINNFTLFYDGIYKIAFEHDSEEYRLKVYLTPQMLIEIMNNENIKNLDKKIDFYKDGYKFSKTTLLLEIFDESDGEISFLTSETAEEYQDQGIYLFEVKIED
jgi:hypothetical protein